MNRILKRPMFRMGGSTGTGITSGLDQSRTNYQFGGGAGMAADNIRLSDLPFMQNQTNQTTAAMDSLSPGDQLKQAFADRDTKPDLSQFLINFGLNLASATPRGNIIATAADAAKAPAQTLFEEKAAEKAFDRELELAATKMDINERLKQEALKDERAREDELLKRREEFEEKTAKTGFSYDLALQQLKNESPDTKDVIEREILARMNDLGEDRETAAKIVLNKRAYGVLDQPGEKRQSDIDALIQIGLSEPGAQLSDRPIVERKAIFLVDFNKIASDNEDITFGVNPIYEEGNKFESGKVYYDPVGDKFLIFDGEKMSEYQDEIKR